MSKREAQSFSVIIGEADRGRVDRILSEKFAHILDVATSKASLHETEWKAEMTLKIKVKAEPNGKVELVFSNPTTKCDEEKMPRARMYYDPDSGCLMNEEPRQVKIPGFDAEGRTVKGAGAPAMGKDNKDN